MKQVIAVDIDDVLSATADGLVAYSNEKWGTRLKVEDYSEDWAAMWQLDQASAQQRADHLHGSGLFSQFAANDQALPVLQKLAKRYDLVIATSRVRDVRRDTLEWLDLHFKGLFHEIHMAGIYDEIVDWTASSRATKAALIAEIGADYLIDDQPKHCFAVAEAGIEAVLFGDYTWQQDLSLPRRVTRCLDWTAVGEYFDERS